MRLRQEPDSSAARTGQQPDRRERAGDPHQFLVAEVADVTPGSDLVGLWGLPPAATGLHPEDGGGDALRPLGGGLAEEELGDLGGRLGGAEVEFVPIVLAEGLRVDADDPGNVGLRDAIGGEGFDLPAVALVGDVGTGVVSGAPAGARSFAVRPEPAYPWGDR